MTLKNPVCSSDINGQFFLTQDKEIVAQAASALKEVEEKFGKGEEPTYRWATGEKALEEKYPSFNAYESSPLRINGEAASNASAVDTGVSESTPVHGAISMSATAPVSRAVL